MTTSGERVVMPDRLAHRVPTHRIADCRYCDRYNRACGRHEPRCACVGRRNESDPHSAHCDLHDFHGVTTGPDAGNVTRTIAFTADCNGVTMTISRVYGANRPLSKDNEMLSFADATELHRALGDLLHNPPNDYSARPRSGDTVHWTQHTGLFGNDVSERTATVESVHGENAYVIDTETGVTTYVGVSQLRRA